MQAEPSSRVIGDAPRVGCGDVPTRRPAPRVPGWLRWWLDQRVGLDYSDLSGAQIAAGALADVDVLVVPTGSDFNRLQRPGRGGADCAEPWVRDGGRLITLRDSSRLATRLGLTSRPTRPRPPTSPAH